MSWFASFVGAAIYARRRADVHKRLMIAACFAIYGPVFARLQLIYGWPTPPPAVILLGLVVLGIYDRLSVGRFHSATKWIALSWAAGLVLLGVLIATRGADTIIHALQ